MDIENISSSFLPSSAYSSHYSGLQRQKRQLRGTRRSASAGDASWPKFRYFMFNFKSHKVCYLKVFFNDNCMLSIYFQGLGLIANDSTAPAAETGAFINLQLSVWMRLNLPSFPNKSEY